MNALGDDRTAVLGIVVVGGWLNLPKLIPIGPLEGLHHWLEPVVGEAAKLVTNGRELEPSHSTEWFLIGVAVAIAITGIVVAWTQLKPERLVPKAQAQPSVGFARVLENKYFVDEGYDKVIVDPTVGVSRNLLWRGIDAGLIDGLMVNGSAALARFGGWVGSQFQSGQVGTYAWVLVVGVLAVLGAFTLR